MQQTIQRNFIKVYPHTDIIHNCHGWMMNRKELRMIHYCNAALHEHRAITMILIFTNHTVTLSSKVFQKKKRKYLQTQKDKLIAAT